MAYLYTKTGDKGETGLLGGGRVSKADLRVECYGGVDEANSMLGLAVCQTAREDVREAIRKIQSQLFSLAAELASSDDAAQKLKRRIEEADIAFLEKTIDACTAISGRQSAFVTPGANAVSAALHVARTIVRRAERSMVRLNEREELREALVRYVNRLSDAIFALARLEETACEEEKLRKKIATIVKQKLAELGIDSMIAFNLESMQKAAKRAREKAAEMGVPIVFAAVDAGGNLVLLERMDGSILGSLDIAEHKAFTAVAFARPTHELSKAAQPGGELFGIDSTNLGKVVLFGGGFPVKIGGSVQGGIGISGGSVEEDMIIARYALELS